MGRLVLLLLAVAGVPSAAAAQVYIRPAAPHRGWIEVGGGVTFVPGFDMGSRTADLTTSAPTTRYDLFTTDSSVGDFTGVHARVGYYFSRSISVKASLGSARPELSVDLSGDAESAADVTATETASHYVFGGSVNFDFRGASFAGDRGVPFVLGGAGYLRELHEGNQLVRDWRRIPCDRRAEVLARQRRASIRAALRSRPERARGRSRQRGRPPGAADDRRRPLVPVLTTRRPRPAASAAARRRPSVPRCDRRRWCGRAIPHRSAR